MNSFTLSNGIRVLHKDVPKNPLFTAQIFMPGGCVNESPEQAGLAAFTQTLMFKSTKNMKTDALASAIEDIGASISSDIDYDFSSLGISAMSSYLDKCLALLADITFNPDFDKKEIEKERSNAIAGIKNRQDHIFHASNDAFNALFYGKHPYSWPEGGKVETVSKFTKEDLKAWHDSFYKPSRMTIVVIGDIRLETAKQFLEKHFGKVKDPASAPLRPAPETVMPKPAKEAIPTARFQQAYLMIGFPAPAVGKEDYAALKTLNAVLGSRMSGRLFTELREKLSLGYEVNSFYPSRKQMSRFVIYLGLEKKNLGLAKSKITEILNDLKKNPVPEKEMQETRNYIKGVYLMDHQTVSRQAWYAGWWEMMGMGYDYDEKYLDSLLKVTSDDIQKAAKKHFNEDYVQLEMIPETKEQESK